ncbi:MAG: AAA family ATPase [Proteobacteria bacterium]|nr:AAA family ATPase [Pseudomonadota bacterium]
MDETAFVQNLVLHIRAGYPLICVETPDDDWLLEALAGACTPMARFEVVEQLDALTVETTEMRTVFVWVNPATADVHEALPWLRKHQRRIKTQVTIILLGDRWRENLSGFGALTALAAPLPGIDSRSAITKLALGSFANNAQRMAKIVVSSAGMTRTQIYRTLSKCLLELRADPSFDAWETRLSDEKKLLFARDSLLEVIDDMTTLNDVGGVTSLKDWLSQRAKAFSQEARDFGLEAPRGILLVGIQGCGKSLLAKAIANTWHFPLLRLDVSALFGGAGANPDAALQRALSIADAMSPAVLWCDEIEKAFSQDSDPTTRRLLGRVLNWLQERRSQVFFVATANDIRQLPSELIRKGRIDELFFVDLPDEAAREQIFAIHLKKRHRQPEAYDCRKLASASQNYSGAEIEQAIIAALFAAFGHGRELLQSDIEDAVHDIVPLYKQREDEIKHLREWATERTRQASQNAKVLNYFRRQ